VEALVLTTAPLVQVVVDTARQRAVLDVFGLVVVRAWHGAGVSVAAGPATGLAGQRDLVAGFEHVGDFHRVQLVHGRVAGSGRLLPGEPQVEVLAIVGGLHLGSDECSLASNWRGFDLLATDHFLAHVGDFFGVAGRAGLAFFQHARAAVLGAFGDPLHWRYAGVENARFDGGYGAPVGGRGSHRIECGQCQSGADSVGYQVLFHLRFLIVDAGPPGPADHSSSSSV